MTQKQTATALKTSRQAIKKQVTLNQVNQTPQVIAVKKLTHNTHPAPSCNT